MCEMKIIICLVQLPSKQRKKENKQAKTTNLTECYDLFQFLISDGPVPPAITFPQCWA